jgi:hypothetical protein
MMAPSMSGGAVTMISYDLHSIERTQAGLERLAADYRSARDDYGDVRSALGSAEVARAIDDFTDDWRKRRDKQLGMIEAAATALETIRQTYTEIDCEGVRTLQQDG